eukprot:m.89858 g.89858  ORF g.89858 m.89858 type:complete len:102 (-) comp14868_c3_seq14:148-453(-)
MAQLQTRPEFCLQHDWPIDVDAATGKFWLSARHLGQPTCHGSVVVVKEGLIGQDGFEAEMDNNALVVKHTTEPDFRFIAHQSCRTTKLVDRASVIQMLESR